MINKGQMIFTEEHKNSERKGVRNMLGKGKVLIPLLVIVAAGGFFLKNVVYGSADKSIHIVQADPAEMEGMMKNGKIDGFVAAEPFNTQAVEDGQGKYLHQSSAVMRGYPGSVLAVSTENADSDAELALVWAHVKATQFIKSSSNHDKVLEYAVQFSGKNREVVEKAVENIEYVNFPEEKNLRDYYDELSQTGMLTKNISDRNYVNRDSFFNAFLYKKYIHIIEKKLLEDPNWIPPRVSPNSRVSLGYLDSDLHGLALYIAEKEGFYRQTGLIAEQNLQLKAYRNSTELMEAFAAHEVTAGYVGSATAMLKRVNDNLPINILAGANNAGSAFVVKADERIDTLEELSGKTIAVPAIGGVQYAALERAAQQNGLVLKRE